MSKKVVQSSQKITQLSLRHNRADSLTIIDSSFQTHSNGVHYESQLFPLLDMRDNQAFALELITLAAIKENDSISHGNQLNEVIVQASVQAAPYFLRRNLLHNQETVRRLDDGGLLLACKNIHENEIVPIVQYWIPMAKIVSPIELQQKMEQKLRDYLGG